MDPFTHLNTRAPLAREGVITLTDNVMVAYRVVRLKRKSAYVNSPPRPKIKGNTSEIPVEKYQGIVQTSV